MMFTIFISTATSPFRILISKCARGLGRGCHNIVELLKGVYDTVRDTLPRKNSSWTTRLLEGVESHTEERTASIAVYCIREERLEVTPGGERIGFVSLSIVNLK